MAFGFTGDLAAVFLPLAGAVLAAIGGRRAGDRFAQFVTCASVLVAAFLSCVIFSEVAFDGQSRTHILAPWIEAGSLKVHWALRIDTLSAIVMMVVNVISAMVHVYAVGYMKGDKSVPRFMAYLSLFTFFMLMLVTSDNLLQLFFGWEGVGLASYLLIGFWIEKASACAASMKAFLVNRIGDFGFLLGIFGCYHLFGTLDFQPIFSSASHAAEIPFVVAGQHYSALTVVALLLFMGAMGKSAQIGLHTWLPDAMEGPTPVSALIHAATMVTAGVFMVARLSPLFEYAPDALAVVAVVGAVTAVFAATIGMTQFDIKRVIAYSTMSQLGYMFFAAGVSAYGASIFHLATHAFFKALLFLAAGSVIHALGGEQDMRKMGGLARKIPVTYGLMWVGSLTLAGIGLEGIFGFAGFYSKDMILEAAFSRGTWFGYTAYGLGLMAAFMTAFYSWRLLILVFHGTSRGDRKAHEHAHESPWIMLGPLMPLAIGAVLAGFVAHNWFASAPDGAFWQNTIFVASTHVSDMEGHAPLFARIAPLVCALFGIALSYWFYVRLPAIPAIFVQKFPVLHCLVFNKYYFDELYRLLFVQPLPRLGAALWTKGDEGLIDRCGPDGVASTIRRIGVKVRTVQTGFVYHYALMMMAALVLLLVWAMVAGGMFK
jgi:NADH-quinone oxidoreductase subunit L